MLSDNTKVGFSDNTKVGLMHILESKLLSSQSHKNQHIVSNIIIMKVTTISIAALLSVVGIADAQGFIPKSDNQGVDPECVEFCNSSFPSRFENCGLRGTEGCNIGACTQFYCPDDPSNVCLDFCQQFYAQCNYDILFGTEDLTNQDCGIPRSFCMKEFCGVGNTRRNLR